MKPFAQARLLRDFCDFNSPVSNTWQSLMNTSKEKNQNVQGKTFGFSSKFILATKKRISVQYDKFDIFFFAVSDNETLTG